jgi:hypothetical protein
VTSTILQSCHVFGNCAVSPLHVDLGLPVRLLFGTLSLLGISHHILKRVPETGDTD